MSHQASSQLATFKAESDLFIRNARLRDLTGHIPGANLTVGECLYPVHIALPLGVTGIRVETSKKDSGSLSFAKIVFAGFHADGDGTLEDVGEYAECDQSSTVLKNVSAKAGISGDFSATNVHTGRDLEPWWQAIFPETVKLRHIFFHCRVDRYYFYTRRLRVVALMQDGTSQILMQFGTKAFLRPRLAAAFHAGVDGLEVLGEFCEKEKRQEYFEYVYEALKVLQPLFAVQPRRESLVKHLGRVFTRKVAFEPANPHKAIEAQKIGKLAKTSLIAAIDLVLGGNKHFGLTPEEGLKQSVGPQKARYIRMRCYGERPYGMAGFELLHNGETVRSLKGRDLRLNFKRSIFSDPASYELGLITPIHTSIADLGMPLEFDTFHTWNINRMNAANTLFFEVCVSDDKKNWRVIYDHGKHYRAVCAAIRLADMVGGSHWSPEYARLMGKFFTQYRRKRLATLVAKITRPEPELAKAVFAGSNWMSERIQYAAPLRLAKHGLQVPLIYRDRDEVMGKLLEVCEALRGFGYTPMLMYGTLLGAIREKGFIPHDDDLDLAIIADGLGSDELLAEKERLVQFFNDNGLKCSNGARFSPLIHCQRPPITIDIFVLGHKDGTIYWPHKALAVVPERADIFLPAKPVSLYGYEFDGPQDVEAVCEARYGADWRVPNPAFEW